MELKGDLTEIIYQNDINSYTVAVFETDDEEFTIVGYLPFINIGDSLKLIGKFVTHQDYGRQFKVETFEKLMPQNLASLEKYLANGAIKGIGSVTAKKIIKKFGEDTVNIFKFEPIKLSQIKGISEKKAIEMAEEFNENWNLWQIVKFLEKFGIGVQNSKNVFDRLGINAIEQIETNPYILVEIVNNVDFKLIDKMAMELGIPSNYEMRISSGIKYAILKATSNGHCCVEEESLCNYTRDLLSVTNEEIESEMVKLKIKEDIIIKKMNDKNWVYLDYYEKAEKNVAEKLLILDNSKNLKKIKNFQKELKNVEEESDIQLSDKQKEAIEAVNDNNVCVITGGPGTGKTTIIKVIISLYKKQGKKTVLCAPTRKSS